MVTVTIKENSKQAKATIEMLKAFPFVEIIDDQEDKALLAMMEKSRKSGKADKNKILKHLQLDER